MSVSPVAERESEAPAWHALPLGEVQRRLGSGPSTDSGRRKWQV